MEEESKLMNKFKWVIGLVLFLGIFLLIGIVIAYAIYPFVVLDILRGLEAFYEFNSYKIDGLAKLGDSFGVFTSLFTFIGIGLLFYSIFLQKKEFGKMTKEAEKQTKTLEAQRFDDKFFQMIGLLNDIVDNLELDGKYRKKEVFRGLVRNLKYKIKNFYLDEDFLDIKAFNLFFNEYILKDTKSYITKECIENIEKYIKEENFVSDNKLRELLNDLTSDIIKELIENNFKFLIIESMIKEEKSLWHNNLITKVIKEYQKNILLKIMNPFLKMKKTKWFILNMSVG